MRPDWTIARPTIGIIQRKRMVFQRIDIKYDSSFSVEESRQSNLVFGPKYSASLSKHASARPLPAVVADEPVRHMYVLRIGRNKQGSDINNCKQREDFLQQRAWLETSLATRTCHTCHTYSYTKCSVPFYSSSSSGGSRKPNLFGRACVLLHYY